MFGSYYRHFVAIVSLAGLFYFLLASHHQHRSLCDQPAQVLILGVAGSFRNLTGLIAVGWTFVICFLDLIK